MYIKAKIYSIYYFADYMLIAIKIARAQIFAPQNAVLFI